jgi:hypothetical protein
MWECEVLPECGADLEEKDQEMNNGENGANQEIYSEYHTGSNF